MQVAGCVNSAWQARRMKTHESGQSRGSGRCPVRMFKEHRGESHGFAAKLNTDRRLRRGTVIALVEQQIERAVDSGQTPGKLISCGDGEQPLRRREHLL